MSAPRLVHVDDSLPGISRERSGAGWRYRDAKGKIIRDREEIDRLNAIALPPAYEDAWFCPRSEEHTSELQSLMRISYAVFCLKKKTDEVRHYRRDFIDTLLYYSNCNT